MYRRLALLSIAALYHGSAHSQIDCEYFPSSNQLPEAINSSTAVFVGKVSQVLFAYPGDRPDESDEIVVTTEKVEVTYLSDVLMVDVIERFKGSRDRYIIETNSCNSVSYDEEWIFFISADNSNVYENVVVVPASDEWLTRLREYFEHAP